MYDLATLQKKFIDLRFGSFIHFNSATVQFNNSDVDDWEFDCENKNEPRRFPFNEQDWNPDALDCDQWAAVVKSAGGRYAALSAKHHEGFALWPTAYSEHSVKNAANKTDVVAAYLEAFRKAGIEAGLYFSVLDLTAGVGRRSCTEAQKRIIKGQLTELLTNYGKIPFLTLDGWNSPWGGPSYADLPFAEINALVKSLQPECLLMVIGHTGGTDGSELPFFENNAGQVIDPTFRRPGILCQKLTRSWFWRADDGETETAPAEWALEQMERYFPIDVNFILNLSPNIHGKIDDNLATEYAKLGVKAADLLKD